MKSALNTLRFIVNHPLNQDGKLKAIQRWLKWQLGSRLVVGPVVVDFVNDSRIMVKRGMTGATGNLYCGLHEFEDMAFLMHFLRPDDLFIDIGANVGAYTILASAAVGAKSVAIEPIGSAYQSLLDNIRINGIEERVGALNIAVGDRAGETLMTSGQDTVNHVVKHGEVRDQATVTVDVKPLSELVDKTPSLIKVDVEGYETEVIAGAVDVLTQPGLEAMIIELNGSGRRYGYDEESLHRDIMSYGFRSFIYEPFARRLTDLKGSHSSSGNTLYIKSKDKVAARLDGAPDLRVNGKQF